MKYCCQYWKRLTNGIDVTAKNEEPNAFELARLLEKMVKTMLGSYCPTCGGKIKRRG